ncbi:hypothetical protein DI487_15855 [Flavobacterium sediminis]|uniref:RHS repeat-associated core domain-containing protein n=1 Tax=Flavobacterium sediminis TaxID=2201181 RepID=A0A2U8QZD3_9FLAO|nr:hypothetical protein DI487_15855 [Flavobacterium sediminis]
MPDRHASSAAYRYGFQGQEKDDEVKGEGNSLNYKFRMHDPRVGRFFAVDPLTKEYPHYTPYSFSGNKVIAYVELEGLEEQGIEARLDMNLAFKLSSNDATTEEILDVYDQIHNRGNRELNSAMFKLPFYNNETALNLIDHYSFGKGEKYTLNRDEMLEVFPRYEKNVKLGFFDFASQGEIKKGEEKDFTKPFETYSGTSGTLGNTTVVLVGKISINEKTNKKQFIGKVIFNDVYDFNPGDRPFFAEMQTRIANVFLAGNPFVIEGSLDVIQQEGGELYLNDGNNFIDPSRTSKPNNGEDHQ